MTAPGLSSSETRPKRARTLEELGRLGSSLRVAFFTDSFVPTHDGVAKVTDTLARSLTRLGHSVTVFTVSQPGEPTRSVRSDGVRVRRFLSLPAPSYPQYRVAIAPWTLLAARPPPLDVIHVHTPGFVGLAGRLAGRRWDVPVVGTYHTNLTDMLRGSGQHRGSRAFFRAWGRFSIDLCRGSDLATAPTESARQALLGPGRVPLARDPCVVSNGVDTSLFRPGVSLPDWRARLGIGDTPLITFLGRLTRDKGVFRFLEALERLDTGRDWFAVIGGEGPHRPVVEERLRPGRPLSARARYLGPVPEAEKAALLAQTSVFVLPSLSDTSSVALLEAMASGAPSVVTFHGGPGEIVRASGVGLPVDPMNSAALARAVERLLDDRTVNEEFARQGRAWVAQHASAEKMASEFVACYRRVLYDDGA